MPVEKRYAPEVRAEQSDKEMSLVGYCATFGQESQDLGGFREMVMPGAFARALREGQDVHMLKNHDPNYVLGRTKNGTLQLKEDSRGLFFRCTLDLDNPEHRAVYSSVKRGDLDGCSFAFIAKGQEWSDQRDKDGVLYAQRKLHDVDLQDASVVTYPAYSQTSVSARSLEDRNFFDAASVVEIRSALDGLEAKRVLETRGVDVNVKTTGMAEPGFLPEDLTKDWKDAYEDAYANAIKLGKKGNVAIACAVTAANTAIHDKVAHAPEDPKEENLVPGENVEDDKSDKHELGEVDEDMRKALAAAELRIYKSVNEVPDNVPADKKKQWLEVWNSIYKKAIKDKMNLKDAESKAFAGANSVAGPNSGKNAAELLAEKRADCQKRGVHTSQPIPDTEGRCPSCGERECRCDCDDPNCWCQNNDVDPVNVWADDDWDDEDERKIQHLAEIRAGKKVRTKTVGGKVLPASAFAFVGDPDKTETWKLPIHDKEHAQNALARFNQTQGIPAAKKASVYAKIIAAAKKFGIHVSEENCFDPTEATQKAWIRLTEIKTEKV